MISETFDGSGEGDGRVERKSLKRVIWECRVGEVGLMLLEERRQRRARRGFSMGSVRVCIRGTELGKKTYFVG